MKNLTAKLKNQGGFTLVEMLIVVAIIAILIAVSIPMVTGALEKARHATDDANHRDAAALGVIDYLSNPGNYTADVVKYYGVVNTQGTLLDANAGKAPTGALKASCTETTQRTDGSKSFKDAYLKVTITKDGAVTAEWSAT